MKIAVIGAGSWGTAVAAVLAARHDVTIWALEPEIVQGVNTSRENPLFHPGVKLPDRLVAVAEQGRALEGAEFIVLGAPTQFVRSVAQDLRGHLDPSVPIVSLAKGIEAGTLLRPTQILAEVFAGERVPSIGVLSGPNLAKEVIRGHAAASVVAFENHDLASWMRSSMTSPSFTVYTNDDVVGVELGGALKNVIAVASGMAHGLEFGENRIAALLSRGLVEMTRLGVALGARPTTFLGLSGHGDLLATALSTKSRNHAFGRELAKGRSAEAITNESKMVAEGVKSAAGIVELADRVGVSAPLANLVLRVVSGTEQPAEAFANLDDQDSEHELAGIVQ